MQSDRGLTVSDTNLNKRQFENTYHLPRKMSCRICDQGDSIKICEKRQKVWDSPPNGIIANYEEMSTDGPPIYRRLFKKFQRQPDQNSKILIPHNDADTPEGDPFGAWIATYNTHTAEGRPYYHHFFVQVEADGPADKMKVKENDELVLLNGHFVPNISHDDLLNVFHKVKVDGKTRLYLVIRRKREDVAKNKKWEWIETSAVLAPDHRSTNDERYKSLGDDDIIVLHYQYKVPGTQLFIAISGDRVLADVMTGYPDQDETKHILTKAKHVNCPDETIKFTATLSDKKMDSYIGMNDSNEIILMHKPIWFEMTYEGSNVVFSLNEKYLACNIGAEKVETKENKFGFEKVPYEYEDHPDNSFNKSDSVKTLTSRSDSGYYSLADPVEIPSDKLSCH